MRAKPDTILNRLVVAALTIFILVILMLAAVVLRHQWLQQHITELNSDVRVNLDDLEEITEEIQRELGELRATPGSEPGTGDWEEIAQTLDDVDEQLDSIGQNLDEVTLALESPTEALSPHLESEEKPETAQDQVDQVFTIFAVLISVASIAIAILLAMAVRVQQSAPREVRAIRERHEYKDVNVL